MFRVWDRVSVISALGFSVRVIGMVRVMVGF
jgi:hypothetical protein